MKTMKISTAKRVDLVDVTGQVQTMITESGIESGSVTLFVPHTTCGITINENTDPDVIRDITHQLEKLVPHRGGYRHFEGNADSHIKTALIGSSETVLINEGRLMLGTWQGIFLCDFDGPRTRSIWVKVNRDP